jgi:hypothetical protein
MFTFKGGRIAALMAGVIFAPQHGVAADTAVGTIKACYYSAECTYTKAAGFSGVVDGPAFEFTNSSKSTITGATFIIIGNKPLNVAKDAYHIGTIAPGGRRIIVVGGTNDHHVHPSTSFFHFIGKGDALDTSDDGPDANTIKFEFKGTIGSSAVTSGVIVTGATAGPSKDGTVASINFLGGPNNADGPCNDCFAPKVIGTITETTAAPVAPLADGLSR